MWMFERYQRCTKLVFKADNLNGAIEKILVLEKQTRNVGSNLNFFIVVIDVYERPLILNRPPD